MTVEAATFLANLREAGIGIVVVLHLPHPGRSPEWPGQRAMLVAVGADAGVRRVFGADAVEVWAVVR